MDALRDVPYCTVRAHHSIMEYLDKDILGCNTLCTLYSVL